MQVADLPHVNAAINTVVAILLLAGLVLVKRGRRDAHRKVMVAALALSVLFLASYVTYHYGYGSTKFTGTGIARPIYFALLLSHTILAVVNLPFVIVTVKRAWRGDFAAHKRVAKYTWYIWFYVAVTGPLVYLMLYQLDDRIDFLEARRLHEAGEEAKALAAYRGLASDGHVSAKCFAAVLGDRLEETETASVVLARAVVERPEDALCLTLWGRELVYAGELDRAIPLLDRATALAPSDALTHASLGFARFRKYDYREAAASFTRAFELEPRSIHLANAGYAHYHYGNYTAARPLFRRALDLGLDGEFKERIAEAADVIDGAKWICPMHAHVTGKSGDRCGECGMNLEPIGSP